jgi:two-component system, OmpR family, alkaline phosphatase synthesis response regulator PhoP
VWGYDRYPTTRTVDTHVLNLRKKLEPDPAQPRHLLTVHGVGYKFLG